MADSPATLPYVPDQAPPPGYSYATGVDDQGRSIVPKTDAQVNDPRWNARFVRNDVLGISNTNSSGAMGLAPGFARSSSGDLTYNGSPPDTYIGGALPGGGAVPAWRADQKDAGSDPVVRAQDYVQRTLQLEGSGKDPNSTAVGGFIDSTWLNLVKKNVPGAANIPDDQILAARSDPVLRGRMVAAYARDNAAVLQSSNLPVNEGTLRLAHWFGPDGARRILTADPNTPVSELFSPEVINANHLEGKTAGQIAELTQQQMSGGTLRQWANSISPEMQARGQALEDEARDMRDQYHSAAAELMRQANEAPPGSRERDDLIDDMRKQERMFMERYNEIASHPPTMKPVDAMANFGSAATIIALIGGLFARNHMTTALSAAGVAMKAINENNYEQYKQTYQTWQQQATTALDMVKLQNEQVRELIDDKKMAVDERNTRLQTMFQSLGMMRQADAMSLGEEERVFTEFAGLERATNTATQMMNTIKMQNYYQQREAGVQGWLQKNPGKTEADMPADARAQIDTQAAAAAGISRPAAAAVGAQEPVNVPDTWEGKPNTPPPGSDIDPGIWSAAITYVKSGGTIKPPFSTWGTNPMATALNRAIPAAQKALGISPEQMASQNITFAADKQRQAALDKAIASPVVQRNILSLNTVADHLGLLREYAEALQNNDTPRVNQLLNRLRQETGHPEINNYQLAATIAGDEIVRLLTTTGGTEADRQDIQQRFSQIGSPAQLIGAIDTASNYVRSRFGPLETMYAQGATTDQLRQDRIKEFEDVVLTPEARALWKGGEISPSGHPTIPSNLSNKRDLQWSASRQQWRDSDGKIYDKDGNPVQ